ncbi:hypothetical protein [Paraglaciecola sp.]|uniref:hypothetical protein n=1 Tax=Paraglaciecola sp. TaxID=1920173 RepID=UPI0030F45E3B
MRFYIVVFFILALPSVAKASIINLTLSNNVVNVGDVVSLNFSISGLSEAPNDSLSAFDLDVFFEQEFVRFESAHFFDPIVGNQLNLTEVGALPFESYGNEISSGLIDVFALSGNSNAALDELQLNEFIFLSLDFLALKEVTSTGLGFDTTDPFLLFVSSLFADLPVSFASSAANLQITGQTNPPNEVPAPQTFSFILLAGVWILRKKIFV